MSAQMTRRGFVRFGAKAAGAATLVVGGAVGLLVNRPEDADVSNSTWHALPQWQSNQVIVNATYQDLYRSGWVCKPWVRSVVSRASGGHVIIPSNAPDESGWYWQQDQHVVGRSTIPEYIKVGEIIQMHWRKLSGVITPHTAIVIGTSQSGMQWIDANWFNQDLTVRDHPITYSAFRAQAVSYSVYYIL
jgi:hypothetical protein